ncbi:myosin heavy chain-like protein [Wolffia australiana]
MATESRKKAELRRCNTELRREGTSSGGEEKPGDENQRLTKELAAYMAAKKSLERMFSRLGVEKEIMAGELEKKEQGLREMEELLNDVKAQNESLRAKVKLCVAEHGKKAVNTSHKKSGQGGEEEEKSLVERNKGLSEQLLKALDGYRSLKRRVRQLQEEKEDVVKGLSQIREFCRGKGKEDVSSIEEMVMGLQARVALMGEERRVSSEEKPSVAA